jgi:trafficking protein particle complex subunit 10
VDYVTTLEPEITRTLQLARVVLVSLPLTINVEDFFRDTRYTLVLKLCVCVSDHCFYRLFTRFTLSTTSHQYIRIKSLDLAIDSDNNDLKITKSLIQNSRITVSYCFC